MQPNITYTKFFLNYKKTFKIYTRYNIHPNIPYNLAGPLGVGYIGSLLYLKKQSKKNFLWDERKNSSIPSLMTFFFVKKLFHQPNNIVAAANHLQ
jgi:hypothetical protein